MGHPALRAVSFPTPATMPRAPGNADPDSTRHGSKRGNGHPVNRSAEFESRIEGLVRSSESLTNEMLSLLPHLRTEDSPTFPHDTLPVFQTKLERSDGERALKNVMLARRQRGRYFDESLFADPAWDILLELALAELTQHRLCVGDLGVGAGLPATTTLRWINALTDQGLVKRRNDPLDARRKFIELSPAASAKMHSYVASLSCECFPVV